MWTQVAKNFNWISTLLWNQQRHVVRPISLTSSRQFHLFSSLNPQNRLALNTGLSNSAVPTNRNSELLKNAYTPLVNLVVGFKVKGRLRRRCKDCYFVIRQERLYVICKTHPRHKQMAMQKSEKNSWILTDATQSKERAW